MKRIRNQILPSIIPWVEKYFMLQNRRILIIISLLFQIYGHLLNIWQIKTGIFEIVIVYEKIRKTYETGIDKYLKIETSLKISSKIITKILYRNTVNNKIPEKR